MKRLAFVCVVPFLVLTASAQVTIPRVPDQNTILLWHLDETANGPAYDASNSYNTGSAFGTTVVTGRNGKARSFNGISDYIDLNASYYPPNFTAAESFTIECWFATSSSHPMVLIRKGLAPDPGYTLIVSAGKVVGIIGNRADGTPPDTLLTITSDSTYNDGQWHNAMLIRDRLMKKLYLYVDGRQAAAPLVDAAFPYPISNNRPLTIGRWESDVYPYFFNGTIDEVRIARGARHPQLATPLMAAWNFDGEDTGVVVMDSSGNMNNGTAFGTTVIAGVTGSARSFNGNGDYLLVDDADNGSLDFDSSQSFTVEAWFKTTSAAPMQLLRKGLAPEPGYGLFVSGGHVDAVIGNREDGIAPDTLLIMHSAELYNDGKWHRATLVRDRSIHHVFLYVDGKPVIIPMADNFPMAIASDRPLTIGRWDSPVYPYYYQGAVDRITISRGALHPEGFAPIGLLVQMDVMDFGQIVAGDSLSRRLMLYNTGSNDTLRVSTITTTSELFTAIPSYLAIGPRDTAAIVIRYRPSAVKQDSAEVRFATNDTSHATVAITLLGRGVAAPMVTMLSPGNYTNLNRDSILFSWRKPQPAPTKYWFEWSTSPTFATAVIDSSIADTVVQKGGFPKGGYVYWRVRARGPLGWGEFNGYRILYRSVTEVPGPDRPSAYALLPNYPNPFNPSTMITFRVPEASDVCLEVFNVAGELIRIAAEGAYQPGEYRIQFDGTALPSGAYFVRMRAGSSVFVQPMLLMK